VAIFIPMEIFHQNMWWYSIYKDSKFIVCTC